MDEHVADPIIKETCARVAGFIVGFARVSVREGKEDADAVGSGTLVTVGPIHGILTAAHVLRNLPDPGEVGIVQFPLNSGALQRTMIRMDYTEKLTIAGDQFGQDGPDLGFLRLPRQHAGALEVRGAFFNLEKQRLSVLAGDKLGESYFDGISGTIDEWTTAPRERGFGRVKTFQSIYGVGTVVGEREANGFDLLDFDVSYDSEHAPPASYEGVSGGTLWRAYCNKGYDGHLALSSMLVWGVAFHQSDRLDNGRVITCHGPRSIYGRLIEAVLEKWPE